MKKSLFKIVDKFDDIWMRPTYLTDESDYPESDHPFLIPIERLPHPLWDPCPGVTNLDAKYEIAILTLYIDDLIKVIDEQTFEPENQVVWPFPDPDLELPIVIPLPDPLPITQTFYRDSYGTLKLNDGTTDLILLNEYMPREPEPGQFKIMFYTPSDHTPFQVEVLNTLLGNSLNNTIIGNQDNNRLDGADGSDTMKGGKGNDLYVVDNVGDVVVELAGQGAKDKVQATIDYQLSANVENLLLVGDADINGDGNELDNLIKGNVGNNLIAGGAGDDSLRGNLGEDTLTGGAGDDVFIFSQRDFSGGADLITDFEVGKDKIVVSNLVGPFHHYTKEDGPLSFSFESGENIDATHTNGALFSYNTKTGKLYFDHDGAGGDDAIHFATLKNAPVITAADLEVKNIYIPPCAVGDDNPYDFFVYN